MASGIRESAKRYKRLNGKYLKDAESLLAKHDYVQASEKLWGAAAQSVKSLAAKRGVQLLTHTSIFQFVTKLHKEHPGLGLAEDFHIASSLHTNFYEDWLTPEMVRVGADRVKAFVEKISKLEKAV